MGIHKIEKAHSKLWGKEITVFEYNGFITTHPHFHSLADLRCVECGDRLVFIRRQDGTFYFAHNMYGDKHEDCPLYTGQKDFTPEFKLKKIIAKDEDIGLTFSMVYESGKWKAAITIPPLKRDMILFHQANHTVIQITYDEQKTTMTLPLNFEQFNIGEPRLLDLPVAPRKIYFSFCGKASSRLELDGFDPDMMLFHSGIPDVFSETVHGSGLIDLSSAKRFRLRRTASPVYTEKPYFLFHKRGGGKFDLGMQKDQVEAKKLLFKKNEGFPYDVYQVVFHKKDHATEKFCNNRGLELKEKYDAVILWPPVIISGESHFVDAQSPDVFFSLESGEKATKLEPVKVPDDFLRVSNLNVPAFYLTRRNKIENQKPYGKPDDEIQSELDCSQGTFYRFMDGALLGPETEKRHKLIPGESILHIASRLAPKTYSLGQRKKSPIAALLKDAIESPSDYVLFSKFQHERLKKRYSDDPYVMDYLDYCLYQNEINEAALRVLVGGI